MFDVNPVPEGNMLSLNVTLDDSRIDIDLAIEAASFFGIKNDEAVKEAKEKAIPIRKTSRSVSGNKGEVPVLVDITYRLLTLFLLTHVLQPSNFHISANYIISCLSRPVHQ